jgi:hypothetical protein
MKYHTFRRHIFLCWQKSKSWYSSPQVCNEARTSRLFNMKDTWTPYFSHSYIHSATSWKLFNTATFIKTVFIVNEKKQHGVRTLYTLPFRLPAAIHLSRAVVGDHSGWRKGISTSGHFRAPHPTLGTTYFCLNWSHGIFGSHSRFKSCTRKPYFGNFSFNFTVL